MCEAASGFNLLPTPEVTRAPAPSSLTTAVRRASSGGDNCSEAELCSLFDEIGRQLPVLVLPYTSCTFGSRSLSGGNGRGAPSARAWQSPRSASGEALKSAEGTVTTLVEAIRKAAEALVWGEQHDGAFFDLFCEKRLLERFVTALRMRSTPTAVAVQLLQALLILVQNMRRATSFYYLLSGGLLNGLFDDPPAFADEEVLAYFAALIKAVALRLDGQSCRLCLVPRRGCSTLRAGSSAWRLPIFEQAALMASHKDAMVRTAMRTAVLSLLRLEDGELRAAAVDAFRRLLARSLALRLRAASGTEASSPAQLCSQGGDEEDLRGFVTELLALEVPEVTKELTSQIGKGQVTWLAAGRCRRCVQG